MNYHCDLKARGWVNLLFRRKSCVIPNRNLSFFKILKAEEIILQNGPLSSQKSQSPNVTSDERRAHKAVRCNCWIYVRDFSYSGNERDVNLETINHMIYVHENYHNRLLFCQPISLKQLFFGCSGQIFELSIFSS